ncbi:hypothetical protein CRG98_009521 [Punica granatum]|uniref:Uncharacterized protein n=1 Tax=Punica granatum TaxID=22663 RepID=A0A2I0KNL2_PUNGR|nr:hypothetical protein CRG98_009521 [Punica granatum]
MATNLRSGAAELNAGERRANLRGGARGRATASGQCDSSRGCVGIELQALLGCGLAIGRGWAGALELQLGTSRGLRAAQLRCAGPAVEDCGRGTELGQRESCRLVDDAGMELPVLLAPVSLSSQELDP